MNLIAHCGLNANKLKFSEGIGRVKGVISKVTLFLLAYVFC